MIPRGEEEDGEAQDAWVFHSNSSYSTFHSTPSHPRIVPNSSDFASHSSLSPLEGHSSNSSHYIPGYSPHLFYSPGLARARPLASEKRSRLLKRMREPEGLVSVRVVTECKIIKDTKSSRRTAKKKLVMEELQENSKSPQVSFRKEAEVGALPELSVQIGESLHLSKKEDIREKIPTKGKPKKSFGVSQTVITSGQRKEAEVKSILNLGDRQEEKEVTYHMPVKKKGAKKAFGKSATMVMECQGSQEMEKPELAQNSGKLKESWRRFCWSPVLVTGFNNTSSELTTVSHQTDMTPLKEGLQRRDVQLQGMESNFVKSQKLVIASKKTQETMMAPKKTQETIMAPQKRWEKKALGEDIEENKKKDGVEKEESSETMKRGSEKEESLKRGWKEKAKDGECYVPPSA